MTTAPFFIAAKFFRYKARKIAGLILHYHTLVTIKLLCISFEVKGEEIKRKGSRGTLIVSNHLSYLDVLVLSSYNASNFVTSIEVKKTPFLGQLCDAGGCLYVERRSRANLSKEIIDITNALKSGLDVVVFPEATSTNGEEVRKFKRPLFKSAIDSGANIVPLTLNYAFLNSKKVTLANRDSLFWYGDMSFFPHFWGVLQQRQIRVHVEIGKVIETKMDSDVSDLALLSHEVVSSAYCSISS